MESSSSSGSAKKGASKNRKHENGAMSAMFTPEAVPGSRPGQIDPGHDDLDLAEVTQARRTPEVDVGAEIVPHAAPFPTRLRPGTPSPSRTGSPHVKEKIRQMSLSRSENDANTTNKMMHVITGSKSAPVPRRDRGSDLGQGHLVHHRRHHKHLHQSLPPQPPQPHHHRQDDHVQFVEPETIAILEHRDQDQEDVEGVGRDLSMSPSTSAPGGPAAAVASGSPRHGHHIHRHDHREDVNATKVGKGVKLAVVKGEVYIPTRTKPRPQVNSFIDTSDLGPPEADKRWLVDMKGFREDEITFTLDGVILKIEGKQSSHLGKLIHHSETISIPTNSDVEALKIYRNRASGTLVLAYLKQNASDIVK